MRKSKSNFLFILSVIFIISIQSCNTKSSIEQTTKNDISSDTNKCDGSFELIKEEIHNDTCFRLYSVCGFDKLEKRWWIMAEFLYNEVLDSTINHGEFYVLDNAKINTNNSFHSLIDSKEIQDITMCKFYYNSPDPNLFIDPFKTGKYKKNKKEDNTAPGL